MSEDKYCDRCGKKLTVIRLETRSFDTKTGKPKFRIRRECPTGELGHYGIDDDGFLTSSPIEKHQRGV